MLTNYWIVWAVITLMLFVDNYIDSMKEWLDVHLKEMQFFHPENIGNTDELTSIQKTIVTIEQRLDAIEKNCKN
jgi:hypothetical protein